MASKRRMRRKHCTRKDQYTQADAFTEAGRLRRITGLPIDAYPCKFGGGHWHVGKRPSKVQQAINSRRSQEERHG